jgi:Ran GTPase-activating protein (RanGAP) involved in mRNA processing and transport
LLSLRYIFYSLSNCQLTNAQLVTVTNLVNTSNIRVLALDQNRTANEMLFANLINDESALKSLSLRGNYIGDNGAKAIGNALKTNRSLTSLSLWDNRIGRDGAEALAEVCCWCQRIILHIYKFENRLLK